MHADPLVIDALAGAVDRFGARWNGYRLDGVEHIPRDRGCLLVLYHGLVPLDGWYLLARLYREHGIRVRSLADRWLFQVPGLAWTARAGGAVVASPGAARRLLADGEVVLVSPGGVREALKGAPRRYRVTWGDRLGFARLALETGAPCLPVFGEHVEELYRAPLVHTRPFQALYEATRLPLVPVVGLGPLPMPVRIRSWIGAPIAPVPGEAPEALRDRVRDGLQALIDAHRGERPHLARGLWERIRPGEGR